jgi:hypothetical protein
MGKCYISAAARWKIKHDRAIPTATPGNPRRCSNSKRSETPHHHRRDQQSSYTTSRGLDLEDVPLVSRSPWPP